jgi:DNA-binding MarR family transcriptional regulator
VLENRIVPNRDRADPVAVLAAWRSLRRAKDLVASHVARDLEAATGLPLDGYLTLLAIHEAGGSLPQAALPEVSGLSQSGVSRMVARMSAAGLVARETVEGDRRGVRLSLSARGREQLLRATPAHNEAVQRRLDLTEAEARRLATVLGRVAGASPDDEPADVAVLDRLVDFGESLLALSANTVVLSDAMRVREALEFELVSDVARHLPRSAVSDLRAAVAAMATRMSDPDAFFRADWDLHRVLAGHCENPVLREIYLRLLDVVVTGEPVVVPTANLPGYFAERLAIHARLIEAVIAADESALRVAVDEHRFTAR